MLVNVKVVHIQYIPVLNSSGILLFYFSFILASCERIDPRHHLMPLDCVQGRWINLLHFLFYKYVQNYIEYTPHLPTHPAMMKVLELCLFQPRVLL